MGDYLMQISKITSNYQTTIPQEIRVLLEIHKGDAVMFEVEGKKVVLKKIPTVDIDYLKAVASTLNEWKSKEDDELFGQL